MRKFISSMLLFFGLMVMAGCVSPNPAYYPQPNEYYPTCPDGSYNCSRPLSTAGTSTYGDATTIFGDRQTMLPSNSAIEVSWDLKLYSSRRGSSRAPERRNCEFKVRQPGAIDSIVYRCDRVEVVDRTIDVYFWYIDEQGVETLRSIDLTAMPGGYIQNGFCESRMWTPSRTMTTRVVWATNNPERGHDPLRRAVGCRPE